MNVESGPKRCQIKRESVFMWYETSRSQYGPTPSLWWRLENQTSVSDGLGCFLRKAKAISSGSRWMTFEITKWREELIDAVSIKSRWKTLLPLYALEALKRLVHS